MRYTIGKAAVAWMALGACAILAQQQQPSQAGGGGGGGPQPSATIPPPIYSSGGSIYNSSTAVEGAGRGSAAMIQAAGEYNYNTAAGMAAAAEAESKGIANSAAALNNYFTLKEMNDNYQMRHRASRVSPQQAAQASRAIAPKRMTAYQLDPVTGEINWPAVLQKRQFAANRQQLEELFAQREQSNGGIGTPEYEAIVTAVNDFQQALRGHIDGLTPAEYVIAKRFLSSLGYEAQFSPAINGVADAY